MNWKRHGRKAVLDLHGNVLTVSPLEGKVSLHFGGLHSLIVEGDLILDEKTRSEIVEILNLADCKTCGSRGIVPCSQGRAVGIKPCPDCGGFGQSHTPEERIAA